MSNQLTTAREAISTHWKPASRAAMDAKRNALAALDAMLAQAVQGEAVQEPVMRIYAEGSIRTVTEWMDGAIDLPDGDYELYAAPIALPAKPEQPTRVENHATWGGLD